MLATVQKTQSGGPSLTHKTMKAHVCVCRHVGPPIKPVCFALVVADFRPPLYVGYWRNVPTAINAHGPKLPCWEVNTQCTLHGRYGPPVAAHDPHPFYGHEHPRISHLDSPPYLDTHFLCIFFFSPWSVHHGGIQGTELRLPLASTERKARHVDL